MKKKEMSGAFDDAKIEEYKKEAREKYGKKEVDECEARTAKYTKADWNDIKALGERIYEEIAKLMRNGKKPSDKKVQENIAEHFDMINEKFYACTPEIYRGLGDLYFGDERFTAFYEKFEKGLAKFMRDAMHAYCDKLSQTQKK